MPYHNDSLWKFQTKIIFKKYKKNYESFKKNFTLSKTQTVMQWTVVIQLPPTILYLIVDYQHKWQIRYAKLVNSHWLKVCIFDTYIIKEKRFWFTETYRGISHGSPAG